jgi:hypothetical protein
MSQFGLREAIYSREAGRFEVKCNEFGETARQLLESEVSLNIPSYVKLLYLTNCVADTPVTGIFSFFYALVIYISTRLTPILVSNPWSARTLKRSPKSKYLWERLSSVDEDMTQAEVYIDTSLQTAKATGVDQDAMMWQVVDMLIGRRTQLKSSQELVIKGLSSNLTVTNPLYL